VIIIADNSHSLENFDMSDIKRRLRFSSSFRNIIQLLGIVITIISLVFAFQRIWAIGHANWEKLLTINVLLIIILGGFIHGLNDFLLGWAWKKLLVWFGESNAQLKICLVVYSRTQIAKFIPGNIFQYPTRHVMGNRVGFRHPALVGAMIYEIMGVLVAGCTISIIGFPQGIYFGNSIILRLAVLPIIWIFPLVIQFVLIHFSLGRKMGLEEKTVWEALKNLFPTWAIYLVFFIFEGILLWCIVGGSTEKWFDVPLLYIISTYAVSSVLGLITPGAPAGLGVREAVMILILTGFIGAPAAAFVALTSRMVVTLGDVIFFLLSYPLGRISSLHMAEVEITVQPPSENPKNEKNFRG
jgi:uncharacterized membrane protein YbhN (UPF0104 family)